MSSGPELIVVGGGIGGAAVALRAAQYGLSAIWILGDKQTRKASRAAYVHNIDNMLGVHPAIIQEKLVELLRKSHGEAAVAAAGAHLHISTADLVDNARARIEADWAEIVQIKEGRASAAVRADGLFTVSTDSTAAGAAGSQVSAPALVLSTGVMDRQPVVHRKKGERELAGIHWLFPYANQETLLYCIRCEGHLTAGRTVAILGGGIAAAEVALMVRERYPSTVVILTAGDERSWDDRRAGLLAAMDVEVVEGRLTEIAGADAGSTLRAFTVDGGRQVEVDLAFVVMGLHRVYNDLARLLGAELEETDRPEEQRHVVIDGSGETSVPGLFAVGDMTRERDRPVMKQIYTAQEYAVRAVDVIDARRRRRLRATLEPRF